MNSVEDQRFFKIETKPSEVEFSKSCAFLRGLSSIPLHNAPEMPIVLYLQDKASVYIVR